LNFSFGHMKSMSENVLNVRKMCQSASKKLRNIIRSCLSYTVQHRFDVLTLRKLANPYTSLKPQSYFPHSTTPHTLELWKVTWSTRGPPWCNKREQWRAPWSSKMLSMSASGFHKSHIITLEYGGSIWRHVSPLGAMEKSVMGKWRVTLDQWRI
jgi:hypothetical protein